MWIDTQCEGAAVSELVRVRLPNGDVVWTRAGDDTQPVDVGFLDERIYDVEGLLETVRGVGESVRLGLRTLAPDTVTVQFGVTLTARTGRVLSAVAEAGGQANLTVTLGWGPGTEIHSQLGPAEPAVSTASAEATASMATGPVSSSAREG